MLILIQVNFTFPNSEYLCEGNPYFAFKPVRNDDDDDDKNDWEEIIKRKKIKVLTEYLTCQIFFKVFMMDHIIESWKHSNEAQWYSMFLQTI